MATDKRRGNKADMNRTSGGKKKKQEKKKPVSLRRESCIFLTAVCQAGGSAIISASSLKIETQTIRATSLSKHCCPHSAGAKTNMSVNMYRCIKSPSVRLAMYMRQFVFAKCTKSTDECVERKRKNKGERWKGFSGCLHLSFCICVCDLPRRNVFTGEVWGSWQYVVCLFMCVWVCVCVVGCPLMIIMV